MLQGRDWAAAEHRREAVYTLHLLYALTQADHRDVAELLARTTARMRGAERGTEAASSDEGSTPSDAYDHSTILLQYGATVIVDLLLVVLDQKSIQR